MIYRLRSLLRSLIYAVKGLVRAARTEQNFRIELTAAAIVLVAAAWLRVTPRDFAVLLLVVVSVLVVELVNTMVEALLDLLKPRLNHYAGVVKDLMAAAVLLTATGAVFIGILILLPYLINSV